MRMSDAALVHWLGMVFDARRRGDAPQLSNALDELSKGGVTITFREEPETGAREERPMVEREGGDGEVLSIEEAADLLGVTPAQVRHVVGGGGVRPAYIVGGRPLVQRGQLARIRDALAGRKPPREAPVLFPGPGLVRGKAGRKPGEPG